jgi:hypothetical protein
MRVWAERPGSSVTPSGSGLAPRWPGAYGRPTCDCIYSELLGALLFVSSCKPSWSGPTTTELSSAPARVFSHLHHFERPNAIA